MSVPPADDDEVKVAEDEGDEAKAAPPEGEPEAATIDPAEFSRMKLPDQRRREMFAIADQLLGGSRIKVVCADGKSRMARIPGKMRRRMWIREGDLCIVQPWEFQDEKADVDYRYMKIQAIHLAKRGLVPKELNVF